MPTPDTKIARLVIVDLYPTEYNPRARCALHSEGIPPEEALSLGRRAMEKLPDRMRGRAFIEGVAAPATVKLVCEHCDAREKPHSVESLKSLLNVD